MQLLSWVTCLVFAVTVLAAEPPTKLHIQTIHKPEHCSVKAAKGDQVQTGTLFSNGQKFDSSHDRGTPLPFTLGMGQVIKGWDEGILGMCLHEKRTLTIPSNLAYGSRGAGKVIPPNAALVFETELVHLDKREEL